MNDNLFTVKTAIVAGFTALGALLGWKGVMLLFWVLVMALDYLSGTMAACKQHNWSSAVAREGLWHKGGMILAVMVAAIADVVMVIIVDHVPIGIQWPGIILPLVLAWYITTELGSILENAVKLGANVPGWLIGILKASAELVETVGDKAMELENASKPPDDAEDTAKAVYQVPEEGDTCGLLE